MTAEDIWEARVEGRVRVTRQDAFSKAEDLRVLGADHQIVFGEGETFGIRGKSDEFGNGLHIVQALTEVTLTGPAVLDGRKWGVGGVDRKIATHTSEKNVLIWICAGMVTFLAIMHSFAGQITVALIMMVLMGASALWPRSKATDVEGLVITRYKPTP